MKLQSASKKEIKRIALGTLAWDVILVAVLFLLDRLGIRKFDLPKVLLSAAIGSAIGVFCFAILCLTVQRAVGMTDQKQMKAKFQLSYNARMLLQAGWVVTAFLAGSIDFIAGAAPVLFPKATVLFLQATGRLMPSGEQQ